MIFKNGVTIMSFIVMVVITAIVTNFIIGAVFYNTDEFKYFINLFKERIKRINK